MHYLTIFKNESWYINWCVIIVASLVVFSYRKNNTKMRSFLVVLAVFGCALASPAYEIELEGRALEDTVNKTLECVRDVLNKGIPDKGLPSCNPLDIVNLDVNFDKFNLTQWISGKINVKNVHVEGITTWHVSKLVGKLGIVPPSYTLDFEFDINRIHGKGAYDGKIKVMNQHELFGKGDVNADVNKIDGKGRLKAKIQNNKITMEEFSLKLLVGKVDAKITGLLNDEEFSKKVSKFISEELPKFLKDNPNWIDENISPIVIKAFNDAAAGGAPSGGIIEAVLEKCLPKSL